MTGSPPDHLLAFSALAFVYLELCGLSLTLIFLVPVTFSLHTASLVLAAEDLVLLLPVLAAQLLMMPSFNVAALLVTLKAVESQPLTRHAL